MGECPYLNQENLERASGDADQKTSGDVPGPCSDQFTRRDAVTGLVLAFGAALTGSSLLYGCEKIAETGREEISAQRRALQAKLKITGH